jgi:hypothetical protein
MTATAPTLFARGDFHEKFARARDHVAVVADDEQEAAMIQLEAEVSAAARRLREANRSGPAASGSREHVREERVQVAGARARIGLNVAPTPTASRDARQEASDADRMQRHQRLAARGAALLATIEAARPTPTTGPAAPPRSMFNR